MFCGVLISANFAFSILNLQHCITSVYYLSFMLLKMLWCHRNHCTVTPLKSDMTQRGILDLQARVQLELCDVTYS